jgi:hypothetical protein
MSDETEKPVSAPSPQNEDVPEDVVTPVDGEIDLARLAPQLRGLYQELLNEPIPDRFTRLLDELSRKEADKR